MLDNQENADNAPEKTRRQLLQDIFFLFPFVLSGPNGLLKDIKVNWRTFTQILKEGSKGCTAIKIKSQKAEKCGEEQRNNA